MIDDLAEAILDIINKSEEPLSTKEVLNKVKKAFKSATRTKIARRLNNLAIAGKINAKSTGGGRGTWIWWKKDVN